MKEEMATVAKNKTEELGKVKDFTETELTELYDTIALGALKFFLLRVDPKKRMIFNPEESIDFHGFTGPFIQYTHARIKSVLRKGGVETFPKFQTLEKLEPQEREIILHLQRYPTSIAESASTYSPALLANY